MNIANAKIIALGALKTRVFLSGTFFVGLGNAKKPPIWGSMQAYEEQHSFTNRRENAAAGEPCLPDLINEDWLGSVRPKNIPNLAKWVWLKIKQEGLHRFWSMFSLASVPFWYRLFEPQPSEQKGNPQHTHYPWASRSLHSIRQIAVASGGGQGRANGSPPRMARVATCRS